jgi:hypothetical protein
MNYNILTQGPEASATSAMAQYNASKSLASQKKAEYTDPLSLVGVELVQHGLGNTIKNVAKKTGFNSLNNVVENIQKNGLSKGLTKTLGQLQTEGQAKGGSIIDRITSQASKKLNGIGLPAVTDLEKGVLQKGGDIKSLLQSRSQTIKSSAEAFASRGQSQADVASMLKKYGKTGQGFADAQDVDKSGIINIGKGVASKKIQGYSEPVPDVLDDEGNVIPDEATKIAEKRADDLASGALDPSKPLDQLFLQQTEAVLKKSGKEPATPDTAVTDPDEAPDLLSDLQSKIASPYPSPIDTGKFVQKINPADVSDAPSAIGIQGSYSRGGVKIQASVPDKGTPKFNPYGQRDPTVSDGLGWKAESARRKQAIQDTVMGNYDKTKDATQVEAVGDIYTKYDSANIPPISATVDGPDRVNALKQTYSEAEQYLGINNNRNLQIDTLSPPAQSKTDDNFDASKLTDPKDLPPPDASLFPPPKAEAEAGPAPPKEPSADTPKPDVDTSPSILTATEPKVESGLEKVVGESAIGDATGIGDLVTGALGVAALVAPLFIHENTKPLAPSISAGFQAGATEV